MVLRRKRLVLSRQFQPHSRLVWSCRSLFLTSYSNELMEHCSTTTPEDEDTDTVTELLEQKKAILTDLDTRITSIIDEDLE